MPITERQHDYAEDVTRKLKEMGYRVEIDERSEKIGYKIREAEVEKVPYMLIVGGKEAESGQVAVRRRGKGDLGAMTLEHFVNQLASDVENRVAGTR